MKENNKTEDDNQKKATRKKTGRPAKTLDAKTFTGWEQLDSLIIWGTEDYCAERLGISVSTLYRLIKKRYKMSFDEYRNKKKEIVKITLFKKQYDVAMAGNPTMLIWLGKNELGQSDKIETKQETKVRLDMSKEEKLEMIDLYKKEVEGE